jgi:hypothetical protein
VVILNKGQRITGGGIEGWFVKTLKKETAFVTKDSGLNQQ